MVPTRPCAHLQPKVQLVPGVVIHLSGEQEAAATVLERPAECAFAVQGAQKICASLLRAPRDEFDLGGLL